MKRILFLCTHNSARSQMAEGWLRHLAGDRYDVHSAGTEATGLRPLAVRAMAEVDIGIAGQESKTLDRLPGAVLGLRDHRVRRRQRELSHLPRRHDSSALVTAGPLAGGGHRRGTPPRLPQRYATPSAAASSPSCSADDRPIAGAPAPTPREGSHKKGQGLGGGANPLACFLLALISFLIDGSAGSSSGITPPKVPIVWRTSRPTS